MGTRADFYIGTGPAAEWIGSITWDGYPDGNPAPIFDATDEASFRGFVATIIADEAPASARPDEGWPWPWPDSRTTDYAYAWTADGVRVSRYGRPWVTRDDGDGDDYDNLPEMPASEVVDMSARTADTAVVMAKSGLIFVSVR